MSERKHIQVHEVMTPMPVPVDGMATVREALNVDYLLVAGPVGVSAGSPDDIGIDLVVATAGGAEHQWAAYRGHPDIRQSRAAKQALDFLRHQMLSTA